MSTEILPASMTVEEFLALPENGMDRELIRGELRERPMTKRNRFHAESEAAIATLVRNWAVTQLLPHGKVYSGEVGCILPLEQATNVGIDVAYFSAETVAQQTDATTMLQGAPVLAVEILSPSDKHEEITEKVDVYLNSGVKLVWIVDPHFKTVTIHRNDSAPQLFNIEQQISGEPFILGLPFAVNELFD